MRWEEAQKHAENEQKAKKGHRVVRLHNTNCGIPKKSPKSPGNPLQLKGKILELGQKKSAESIKSPGSKESNNEVQLIIQKQLMP